MIASFFGGRVAEEMIFGADAVTTGASNDIQRATDLARKLVTEFGFSEKLGPLRYNENQEEVFLGHSVTQHKNMSDATARVIDEEIRRFVEEGEQTARTILTEHIDELEAIAKGLLEYETLSREDIDTLIRGEPLVRDGGYARGKDAPRRSSVPTSGPQAGGFGTDAEPLPGE
jgi:cell division protease FtsH